MSTEVVGLGDGQMWFVLTDQQTNNVDLFKIVGVWNKVIALQRPGGSSPRYYLIAALRFVERVPV